MRVLAGAIVLTLSFAVIEFLAGLWSGSLALMADAGHMLTDSSALALAALASWIASRPADRRHSWGHGRAEVLAAMANALILIGLVAVIIWQAVGRLISPPEVQGAVVVIVALIGLVVNLSVLAILRRGKPNINVRGAILHVMGDLLGSLAALSSGIVILATGWMPIDPVLSIFIAVLILIAALRLLYEGVGVVMESVPDGIDPEQVREAMCRIEEVIEIHDLHIWAVSGGRVALSAHVVIERLERWPEVLDTLVSLLDERFDIDHPTLQVEPVDPADC